nr:ribonuclease H-like domain-containing protein [Tanacetum cinerariifolium]
GLNKEYDRFQTLLSHLEIHGAGVSHEEANQNFLRSLPSSWSQVASIMRTKPGLDTLSFDDLYNNLRVFEHDFKGTTKSSSNTQNVAFVSAENTSSTNDGTKTAEQEMLDTMETTLKTMVEDLHIKMTQKLWLPLMERILTGLDMLRKISELCYDGLLFQQFRF